MVGRRVWQSWYAAKLDGNILLPCSNSNCNSYGIGFSYTYAFTYGFTNADAYAPNPDGNCDSDSHTDCNTDCYRICHCERDAHGNINSKT